MTDLNRLLKDGDPFRDDGGLTATDAQRMRHVVVAAAAEQLPVRTPWLRPFSFAAVGTLLVVVGTFAGHRAIVERVATPMAVETVTPPGGAAGDVDCRQLQFATPGGTRIIWIFDQNLRLQESMP